MQSSALFIEPINSEILHDKQEQSFVGTLGNEEVHGIFQQAELKEFGEIRALTMYSKKVRVVNFFFYPNPELAVPVYAAEFVNLNDKRLVVAIDAPGLFDGTVQTFSNTVEQDFVRFLPPDRTNDEIPEWYKQCGSGFEVFWKSDNQKRFQEFCTGSLVCWAMFLNYKDKYCQQLPGNLIEKHHNQIQNYKNHHRINSPGLPLMNNCFGEAWVDKFMREDFFV